MKKALALLLAVMMGFALAACGASAEEKIADFVREHEDELVEKMVGSAESTAGMDVEASIKASGLGMIMTLKFGNLQDVPESTKELLQQQYDAQASTFEDALEMMQTDLPELEYYKVLVCDKDGDVLATVVAGD